MLFYPRRLALLAAFSLLLSAGAVMAAQNEESVTDLRITAEADRKTRVTLEITGSVPYRSFVLNNPPRVVIDLPRMAWRAPMNKGDRNGYIKSYRRAVFQGDTLRLVLDLNKPVVVTAQKQLPPEAGRHWRYAFDLLPVSPVAFQQALNKPATGNAALPGPEAGQTKALVPPANAAKAPHAAPPSLSAAPPAAAPGIPGQKPVQTAPVVTKKPLIIIDPGHGGVDPGALASNGAFEKNITLATAKEVKRQLEETGKYRVQLTRGTDIYIKLPERVRIARSAGADLFISLHADTIARPEVQGASVYTLSDRASDIESAKLAERENAVDSLVNVDVGQVDADVADILIDLVTRDTMNQSRILAETVVGTFGKTGIRLLPQLPHRSAGFAVLKSPDIPSVLIEMGYLSNHQEAELLASAPYRTKLAGSVARVIDRYFSETSKTAMY